MATLNSHEFLFKQPTVDSMQQADAGSRSVDVPVIIFIKNTYQSRKVRFSGNKALTLWNIPLIYDQDLAE